MPRPTIIPDNSGKPLYVLVKYEDYLATKGNASKKVGKAGKPPATKAAAAKSGKVSGIAAARERLGITKSEMARRIGVSFASYHLTEKAKNPRPATLAKIAKVLGVSVEKLTG